MDQLTCPKCNNVNDTPVNFCRICSLPFDAPAGKLTKPERSSSTKLPFIIAGGAFLLAKIIIIPFITFMRMQPTTQPPPPAALESKGSKGATRPAAITGPRVQKVNSKESDQTTPRGTMDARKAGRQIIAFGGGDRPTDIFFYELGKYLQENFKTGEKN